MLAKTSKRQKEPRSTQGVDTARNGLYPILLQGLAIALVPGLLLVVWLLLWRQPALEQALVREVAGAHVTERATALVTRLETLRARLQQLLTAGTNTAEAASARPARFADAVSLRIFTLDELGTAGLDGDRQDLRNHIEIDLVRRAANGETPPPEAYRIDGDWLLSLATPGPAADGSRLVALLTLDPRVLGATEADGGRFTVLQRLPGAASREEAMIAGKEPGPGAARAAVAGTPWTLVFTPGTALLARLQAGAGQPGLPLLGLLVAVVVAFLLLALRYPALLRREVARVQAAAEHRTPYTLRVPELAPLARQLRKVTLRRARLEPVGKLNRPAPAPERGEEGAPALANVAGSRDDLPPHIFRAYDIRGIADSELDDDTVYRIGAAFGSLADKLGEQTIVLACDGRASSGRIKAGLERALLRAGRDVIDIGLVPTPLLYFATNTLEGAGSGVMVTGSHNPPAYNGMKMVLKRQPLGSGDMDRLRAIATSGKFSEGRGHLLQQDVIPDYLDEVVSDVALAMPLKLVIDAGNGAAGPIAPTLFEELGCEVVSLHCDVDSSFPNRAPDCSVAANLGALVDAVRREHADFGVAFDGDGDRVAAVTGAGEVVDADYLLMLFARDVITRNPGADVVYDVKCSRNLAQLVAGLGGRGVLWRSGHTNIRSKVAETGALIGGEFSGHMIFGERWYGFDDGLYAAARLAEIVSSSEDSLDRLLAQLPQSQRTPEIRIAVDEQKKFQLVDTFRREADFGNGRVNDLDGVRVDFPRGWGLLRASNTSAALTARFEADDAATLQEIMDLFREQLTRVHPQLSSSF